MQACRTLNIILIAFLVLSPEIFCQKNNKTIWVEESFKNFRDGTFDAAGRNLYVTNKGTIKTINRFDFNSDGYIDFPVNSSHDVFYNTPATCLHLDQKGDKRLIERLPVEESIDAVVSDLNMDQHMDIVILPNANGVSPRRYLTILWGTETGWVNERKTSLITMDAVTVQVADLYQNKWPEIIVLNGTRWSPLDGPEAVARIYWGSEQGYLHYNASDIVVDRAVDMQVTDMDQNGLVDLEVDHAGRLIVYDLNKDNKLDLFATGGTPQTLRINPTTNKGRNKYSDILYVITEDLHDQKYRLNKLSVPPASNFGLDDLDQDGNTDIVLTDSEKEDESLFILWGNSENYFDSTAMTSLKVSFISAVAFADINGDNFKDIIAGIGRTKETYKGDSYILMGKGRREFIPLSGRPIQNVSADYNKDGYMDITIAMQENHKVIVLLGGENGFSSENSSSSPIPSPSDINTADLNNDGMLDLLVTSNKLAPSLFWDCGTYIFGGSLKPFLNDQTLKWDKPAISQFPRPFFFSRDSEETNDFMGYSVRTDQYRYTKCIRIETGEVFARELYNHFTDPYEEVNIAKQENFKKIILDLDQILMGKISDGYKNVVDYSLIH